MSSLGSLHCYFILMFRLYSFYYGEVETLFLQKEKVCYLHSQYTPAKAFEKLGKHSAFKIPMLMLLLNLGLQTRDYYCPLLEILQQSQFMLYQPTKPGKYFEALKATRTTRCSVLPSSQAVA